MTRDEFITQLGDDIRAQIPTNVTMSSTDYVLAYNTVLGTLDTTQPTLKPTVRHITDLQFD